jgi:hypothetical protein
MSNHPVLNQVKLDVKQTVKDYILTAIELDMLLQSMSGKDQAIERIKDIVRNV